MGRTMGKSLNLSMPFVSLRQARCSFIPQTFTEHLCRCQVGRVGDKGTAPLPMQAESLGQCQRRKKAQEVNPVDMREELPAQVSGVGAATSPGTGGLSRSGQMAVYFLFLVWGPHRWCWGLFWI